MMLQQMPQYRQVMEYVNQNGGDAKSAFYAKAKEIITENRAVLNACAELLLEKEKIGRQEFEALFEA